MNMALVVTNRQNLHIFVMCYMLTFVWTQNISIQKFSFDELCNFQGLCLNCTDGGCDDLCQFYDNVCCGNTSSKNALLEKWQYECVRMFPEMYDLNLDCRGSSKGVYGVYMVTKCSKNWTDGYIKAKCEENSETDILESIPVSDNNFEKVVYKNMYCAFCNMLDLKKLQFWKFDLMCSYGANEKKLDDCFIRLVNRPHRMCAMNVVDSCPGNDTLNSTLRHRCEFGLSQNVYVWKHVNVFDVYKNEFCAQCNFVTEKLQCWAFQAFTCWPQDLPPYTNVQAMISLVLYDNNDGNSMTIFNNDTCSNNEIYNPLNKYCLNITCLPLLNTCLPGKCNLVNITDFNFQIQNDTSPLIFDLESVIRKGHYFVRDDSIYVCLDDYQYLKFMNMRTSTESSESTETPQRQITSTITVVSCSANLKLTLLVFLLVVVVIVEK